MSKTFRTIDAETVRTLKLIMTDVDGTLLASGQDVDSDVEDTLHLLQQVGIVVGLVSGRTMKELETMAVKLGLQGPIIAENGGVAKCRAGEPLFELGYSRHDAEESFAALRRVFPESITGRQDNEDRLIDIVIRVNGISPHLILKHIGSTQLLDSGYIMHLMQAGISKGNTLVRLMNGLLSQRYEKEEVMVFGDSATDVSLFEAVPKSVLVHNPNLPEGQDKIVREKAAWVSQKEYGSGFIEVALHIIDMRNGIIKK
jgi:hydroxymethylpyrimidine pyrophosphatase-like HAD family hydrolase